MAWPGLELFSIGRRMHSTGFCVPWMVSVSCPPLGMVHSVVCLRSPVQLPLVRTADRKSTRLNSSHQIISYAVFCLKKKKKIQRYRRKNKLVIRISNIFKYHVDASHDSDYLD